MNAPRFRAGRAFDAIAKYFEQLHRPPFSLSQSVSIARALRPVVAAEAWRRQAHGRTGPGRPLWDRTQQHLSVREFVARCVCRRLRR